MRYTIDQGQLEQAAAAVDVAASALAAAGAAIDDHAAATRMLGERNMTAADQIRDGAVLVRKGGRDVMVGLLTLSVVLLIISWSGER